VVLLFRPTTQMQMFSLKHQMVVGRSHVNPAILNSLPVLRMTSGQLSRLVQNFRKEAPGPRRQVDHDEQRTRKISRKLTHKLLERLDTTPGRPDCENIVFWQAR
jgi:hypothetical protein